MQLPLVSIIIPTFNSTQFLDACLSSVKGQSYENIELIVVDNNSVDDTKTIAARYTKNVFNLGPERSAQRNFGVAQSTGKYVAIIDSDMVLSSDVVKSCVQKLEIRADWLGLIIPEESFGNGWWAKCKTLERSFYVGVEWMEAARFFRKQAYADAGGYNENMVSGEDWDLSQRIGRDGEIGRIENFIYHNEGTISLLKTIKKKYYYAQKFARYVTSNKGEKKLEKQTGIVSRYYLFFSKPKKLFGAPLLGLSMIFMKTCEFSIGGLGYLIGKMRSHEKYTR
uniref:glycosyltransferase family 2 protein n=1 Tax=Flavobacterium sp. TaxID=239 RepID=UPI004048D7F6